MQRGGKRLAHPAGELGRLLVAPRCGGGKLLLDLLDVTVELHRDITMTSYMQSVKRTCDIAAPSPCRRGGVGLLQRARAPRCRCA